MVNSASLGKVRVKIEKNPLESLEIPPNQLKALRHAASQPHSLALLFRIRGKSSPAQERDPTLSTEGLPAEAGARFAMGFDRFDLIFPGSSSRRNHAQSSSWTAVFDDHGVPGWIE
jgi:hypothetical protein